MKDLIYFVVGGDDEYVQLLEYCINTIRCYPENDKFDILVMCDEKYVKNVQHLPVTHIHITPNNQNKVYASMRKVEIFEFKDIDKYDKILFLDCDIVIIGSLVSIMNRIIDTEKLYALCDEICDWNSVYFSRADKPYTSDDIQYFKQHNMKPFNAGQFAFCNSPKMKEHFQNIKYEIEKYYDANIHFYEQGFMNEYFSTRRAVCYDFVDNNEFSKICSISCIQHILDKDYTQFRCINHFANFEFPYFQKLEFMKECHSYTIKTLYKPLQIDSRECFHQVLNLPNNANIMEIGVYKGDYAEYILDYLNPNKLTLIDSWEDTNIMSGDKDGNNVETINGSYLYQNVLNRFKNNENVLILRQPSYTVNMQESSVDMIYIDADHSYEGVKQDLNLALKWSKPGGWICGHDYSMNYAKAQNHYDFGVKKAVDEFCIKHGLRIQYLANDGCTSYAIRK